MKATRSSMQMLNLAQASVLKRTDANILLHSWFQRVSLSTVELSGLLSRIGNACSTRPGPNTLARSRHVLCVIDAGCHDAPLPIGDGLAHPAHHLKGTFIVSRDVAADTCSLGS